MADYSLKAETGVIGGVEHPQTVSGLIAALQAALRDKGDLLVVVLNEQGKGEPICAVRVFNNCVALSTNPYPQASAQLVAKQDAN